MALTEGVVGIAFLTNSADQLSQSTLVEHLGAEILGLGELRAGTLAGDDVVGLLRDRAGDLAAGAADQLRRLLAAQVGQGPGDHQGLAVERPSLPTTLR